jgi:hypothetical protein
MESVSYLYRKPMKKQWIERKAPRYSTVSYLLHYAYFNEYPKNAEKFVWSIPMKYENLQDREISALTTCYIYDGTMKGLNAAIEVDKMFGGYPAQWFSRKRLLDMILCENQNEVIYGNIRIKDLFTFFTEVYKVFCGYKSIKNRLSLCKFDTLQENIKVAFSGISAFGGDKYIHFARRNLFLTMMAHCYNDYEVDESQIIVPLFERQLYTCKQLRLLPDSAMVNMKSAIELTDNLRWFSENHPITFWVGILAYQNAVREEDKMLKKLAKMKLTRRKFNKR